MDNNSSNNSSNPPGDTSNISTNPPPIPNTQASPSFNTDQAVNPVESSLASNPQSQFPAQTLTPAIEQPPLTPPDLIPATFGTGDPNQQYQQPQQQETPLPSFDINASSVGSNQNLTQETPVPPGFSSAVQATPPPTPEAQLPEGSIPTDIPPASPTPTFGSLPEQMPQTTKPGVNGELTEPAPTDLSQLTGNNNDQSSQPTPDIYNPTVAAPETLVVPSAPGAAPGGIPAATQITPPTQKSKIILLVAGALILLFIVGAASAYFILGIGKSPQTSTSLPLSQPSQPPLTKPPSQNPTPIPISQNDASGVASGSASFGDLNGSSNSSTPSPTKSASSAADLLKARQNSSPRP